MTDLLRYTTEDDGITLAREEGESEEQAVERREIDIRVMPWNVITNTPQGRESFARDAFEGVDPTDVIIESQRHDGAIVGAGTQYRSDATGGYIRARISPTAAGDEMLQLVKDKVLRRASVLFTPTEGGSVLRSDGVIERRKADLRRVAIVPRGAYPGAEVIAYRSEEETMPETQPAAVPSLDQIEAAVRAIVADAIPAPIVQVPGPTADPAPLARAESLNDFYTRVLDGDHDLARALADAVTGDAPSLVQPGWLTTITSIFGFGRPVVNAFGRDPLPESGMSVHWPTFNGDYTGRVGEQAAEKAEIVSKKIVLADANAAIKTYAGGVDLSWQAIRRSSPSYRDAVIRIISIAYAMVTDKVMSDAAAAVAVNGGTVPLAGDSSAIAAALFGASADVEDATGSPAGFVLAGPDAWLRIATSQGLVPGNYGTQNVAGTADAASLRVSVSGLTVVRARNLAPDIALVSNGLAGSWLEDGPFTAEQDVVAKLGTDTAVWGLGAPAIFIPTGVVKVTFGATTRAAAASTGK